MGKQLRNARHRALMGALKAARQRVGLTQRDLAKRLGRSHSFVGKIESGERQLNVLEFCELADALGVDPKRLFAKVVKPGDRVPGSGVRVVSLGALGLVLS